MINHLTVFEKEKLHSVAFKAVVAMSENRCIGYDQKLPWQMPADLRHFKEITTGHTVLMGRKTYESIGRPLPNRVNLIFTRNAHFIAPGCIVLTNQQELVNYLSSTKVTEVYVIGGAEIYQKFFDLLQQIYLTIVHGQFAGDRFFPDLDETEWRVVTSESHHADEKNPYDYTFQLLQKYKNV